MRIVLWVTHDDGWEGELVLEDGALSGDPLAVQVIRDAALDAGPVIRATPSGPFLDGDLLSDPVAFYLLARVAFVDVDVQRTGEDPRAMLDALLYPEGATEDDVF